MYATVMTRGNLRSHDYSYFPPVVGDSWWRAYRDETSFEHPTLLLESNRGDWRLYAGGIPSDRCDSTGTRIQYSCILTGKLMLDDDVSTARSLISSWIRDEDRSSLGHVLDQWATEDKVSAWFQSSDTAPSADDVAHAVAGAIRQTVEGMTDPPSADTGTLTPRSPGDDAKGGSGSSLARRAGGLASPGGEAELLAAATRLLGGEVSGCALVLNLVNFSSQQPSEALGTLVSPLGPYTLILDMASSEPVRDVHDWPVPTTEVVPPKATQPDRTPRKTGSILAAVRVFSLGLCRFFLRLLKILSKRLSPRRSPP
ncbi:MAG: hypothetical protein ACRDQ4_02120 [Pseudonocardiaceae bacterium]